MTAHRQPASDSERFSTARELLETAARYVTEAAHQLTYTSVAQVTGDGAATRPLEAAMELQATAHELERMTDWAGHQAAILATRATRREGTEQ